MSFNIYVKYAIYFFDDEDKYDSLHYTVLGPLPTYPGVNRRRFPVVIVVDGRKFLFLEPQELHGEVKPHWLRPDFAVAYCHHATPHLRSTKGVSSGGNLYIYFPI